MNCCRKGVVWVLLLIWAGIGCKEEQSTPFANPTQIDAYFPLADFLEQKIDNSSGRKVVKTIRFNDEEEQVEFTPDQESWRKELDFFFQSDINKAALASSYETREEGGVLIHSLKPGEKNNIQEIRVSKQEGRVDEIAVIALKDNLFYRSQVQGTLGFDANEQLISYSLEGNQKVWFLDATDLQVQATVGG
ncbi:hypothetical protein SAMN04488057_102320 [Cyclobacterium lianum]|uniref:Uncharacterized protein n=1 Tax=Cyclobacterium lianum TaxID=388280 RepID=A0A1M7K7I1_9BACT|nr:hypothetical protein [Cyclobacterium lianum]SHM60933.1 hypothetical protein SAMN04488057_102320 [Cyclobacterium lianum]